MANKAFSKSVPTVGESDSDIEILEDASTYSSKLNANALEESSNMDDIEILEDDSTDCSKLDANALEEGLNVDAPAALENNSTRHERQDVIVLDSSEDELSTDNFTWRSKAKPISQQNSFLSCFFDGRRKSIPGMLQEVNLNNSAPKKRVSIPGKRPNPFNDIAGKEPRKKRKSFVNASNLNSISEKLQAPTTENEKENLLPEQRPQELGGGISDDDDDDNFDPLSSLQPYEICDEAKNLSEQLQKMHFQPKLPQKEVWVPRMKMVKGLIFYLQHDQQSNNQPEIEQRIQELGGKVVGHLEAANCVIFKPSLNEMESQSFFFLLTAAAGGRYLLTEEYIAKSHEEKKFLDVKEFSDVNYYKKMDVHHSILAAVKMSNSFRQDYEDGKKSPMWQQNILFADPRGENKDVMLFLRIAGAFVQPYHPKAEYDNHLVTAIVNCGKVLPAAKCVPMVTPEEIRNILLNTYNKFFK